MIFEENYFFRDSKLQCVCGDLKIMPNEVVSVGEIRGFRLVLICNQTFHDAGIYSTVGNQNGRTNLTKHSL